LILEGEQSPVYCCTLQQRNISMAIRSVTFLVMTHRHLPQLHQLNTSVCPTVVRGRPVHSTGTIPTGGQLIPT
jgi:hypothetical protein